MKTIRKITLEIYAGSSLHSAAKEAIALATLSDAKVEFKFNGVKLSVSESSDIQPVEAELNKTLTQRA